uniref:Uncharacterized protein n=1 Tax=Oryza glumipatula TaxID=40148 RepID=A0A0D9ZUT3_9ORYZ
MFTVACTSSSTLAAAAARGMNGKKPARVWGSFLRWSGSEMRPRHRLDTHLHRQIDLAGRRERMSMMRSSVSSAAGFLVALDPFFFLDPFAMSPRSATCKWGARAHRTIGKQMKKGAGEGSPARTGDRETSPEIPFPSRRRRRRRPLWVLGSMSTTE